jgi:hypothetical protein
MIRERLEKICYDLYMFCRDDHSRTYKLIDLMRSMVVNDKELESFLEKCSYHTNDPRSNPGIYRPA